MNTEMDSTLSQYLTGMECFIDQASICVYLDIPVCCHPDHEIGEVTEDYCKTKCEYRTLRDD